MAKLGTEILSFGSHQKMAHSWSQWMGYLTLQLVLFFLTFFTAHFPSAWIMTSRASTVSGGIVNKPLLQQTLPQCSIPFLASRAKSELRPSLKLGFTTHNLLLDIGSFTSPALLLHRYPQLVMWRVFRILLPELGCCLVGGQLWLLKERGVVECEDWVLLMIFWVVDSLGGYSWIERANRALSKYIVLQWSIQLSLLCSRSTGLGRHFTRFRLWH